jgi:hypothetical protein
VIIFFEFDVIIFLETFGKRLLITFITCHNTLNYSSLIRLANRQGDLQATFPDREGKGVGHY